jgi:hypothetical protein
MANLVGRNAVFHKRWYYGQTDKGKFHIAQWDAVRNRFLIGLKAEYPDGDVYVIADYHHIEEGVVPSPMFAPIKAIETGLPDNWVARQAHDLDEAIAQYRIIKQIFDGDENAVQN